MKKDGLRCGKCETHRGLFCAGAPQYPELTKVWSFIKNLHSLYLCMIDRKQKSVINLIYYKLSASEKKSFLR